VNEPKRPISSLFETRSQAWREVGLSREIAGRAVRRARVEAIVLVPLFAGVILLFDYRQQLFGLDEPVRVATVIVLMVLGWWIARDIGRGVGPLLFRRMEPGTAGTVGFLVRLATVAIALVVALHIAGLDPRTIAVGGAFTAVIFGLAAQQTLGNLIAGMVLLSARPFRVGERVRLQGGGIAGQIEGVVSSLGLLYTTLTAAGDQVMVPNSVVLNISVTPLREPEAVSLRARLRPGITPQQIQATIEEALTVELRSRPDVTIEELDGDELVVTISATPQHKADGAELAAELLEVVSRETVGAQE
jgi:small-conductance mechanosensitive channel